VKTGTIVMKYRVFSRSVNDDHQTINTPSIQDHQQILSLYSKCLLLETHYLSQDR